MSGSSFDNSYARAEDFAEELERRLNADTDFEPETISTLRDILLLSTVAAQMMRLTDLLYSGDIWEQAFLRAVEEIGEALQ